VLVSVLVVVFAIIIGIAFGIIRAENRWTGNDTPTLSPTAAPTPKQPTPLPDRTTVLIEFNNSLPIATVEALRNMSSPQFKAYQWSTSDEQPLFLGSIYEDDPFGRLTQLFALATLYFATNGDTSWNYNFGWMNPNISECEWYGCTCSSVTNVLIQALLLSDNGLVGTLPLEISLLTNLKQLRLSNNQLRGLIPTEMGQLTSLTEVELFSNGLTGTIPTELGLLTDLFSLDLSRNQLTGRAPSELCGLVSNGLPLKIDCNEVACNCGCDCGR
jgi:hypothetical protein